MVHPAHLRDRDVRLVDHEQPVLREVVEQRRRRLAGLPPREVAGVVLDAVAVAELGEHVEVEHGALRQALRLEQLAGGGQLLGALVQLGADVHQRLVDHPPGDDVVRGRVDREARVHLLEHGAAQRVDAADALDGAVEELDAHRVVVVRRVDLEHVAAHPERARHEVELRPLVLHRDELTQHRVHPRRAPRLEQEQHAVVGGGVAEAVDARHRRDDQHVAPLEQRPRRRQAQAVDLLVDRGLLLDVGVGGRDVRLGLVVVVVGDEVLDRVLREEPLELLVELRRERLVVREHQRRPVQPLDHLGDGERLAGAGDAEQRLRVHALLEAAHQTSRSPPPGRRPARTAPRA